MYISLRAFSSRDRARDFLEMEVGGGDELPEDGSSRPRSSRDLFEFGEGIL